MPASLTYPGVYLEELPSGVRTITGVGTSTAAFLGFTPRGPVHRAVRVQGFADFERAFGGLSTAGPLGHAVRHFFLNGGAEAFVVRAAAGAQAATVRLLDAGGANPSLDVAAASPGAWGNTLRLTVDYDTASPESTFNLRVVELVTEGTTTRVGRSEAFTGLTMNGRAATYAVDAVNAASQLVRLTRAAGAAGGAGTAFSGPLSAGDLGSLDAAHDRIAVWVNGRGPFEVPLALPVADLGDLRDKIAAGLAATGDPLAGGVTIAVAGDRIQLTSGAAGDESAVRVGPAATNDASVRLRFGVVNGGREVDAAGAVRPAPTGTMGGGVVDTGALATGPLDVTATPRAGGARTSTLTVAVPAGAVTPPQARTLLEQALRGSTDPALRTATVSLVNGRLLVAAGDEDATRLSFGNTLAAPLGLTGGTVNVAQYALGTGPTAGQQVQGTTGSDGTAPGPADLIGSRAARTGLYALEAVDLFNMLLVPGETSTAVLGEALAYCTERRAMLIVDPPQAARTVDDATQWLATIGALRSRNAAAYFPWIVEEDPVRGFRPTAYPPSGAVAGVWARTDVERGVWKAPAGTDAVVRGVVGLAATLTDAQNGVLNPLGLNVLRTLPVFGSVVWGARTLRGADQMADEYKYVPVRRLALFLEESLFRGLHWVVFEPNDEPLWAQIRLNAGAFMQTLFRQGAFAGRSPREAYFVKCDAETTTQNDVNLGVVNVVVGFAPLKPAEFVVIKLQQMAGQVQA